MRILSLALLLIFLVLNSETLASSRPSSDVASMRKKIERIQANGRLSQPDPTPTIISEQEVNAYLASEEISLPQGVNSVKLQGQSGVITGTSQVDFDKVRQGVGSSNPLLAIFSGVHTVVVVAHAHGSNHTGFVHIDSVSLDGVDVPRFLLQLFVEKYLQPKYPQLGLDSKFALSDRIDSGVVGSHNLTVIQK